MFSLQLLQTSGSTIAFSGYMPPRRSLPLSRRAVFPPKPGSKRLRLRTPSGPDFTLTDSGSRAGSQETVRNRTAGAFLSHITVRASIPSNPIIHRVPDGDMLALRVVRLTGGARRPPCCDRNQGDDLQTCTCSPRTTHKSCVCVWELKMR